MDEKLDFRIDGDVMTITKPGYDYEITCYLYALREAYTFDPYVANIYRAIPAEIHGVELDSNCNEVWKKRQGMLIVGGRLSKEKGQGHTLTFVRNEVDTDEEYLEGHVFTVGHICYDDLAIVEDDE